jgi:hypothetical protein
MKTRNYLISIFLGMFIFFAAMAGARAGSGNQCKDTLGLNWSFLIGDGFYETTYAVVGMTTYGVMAEMVRGIEIPTVPGLEVGLAPGFMMMMGQNSFAVLADWPTAYTQDWKVKRVIMGPTLMAKYMYSFNAGPLEIGIENSFGAGYLFQRVVWEWVNRENSNMGNNGSLDQRSLEPLVNLGLEVKWPLGEISKLGASFHGMLTPLKAGDFTNPLILKCGINYHVNF